MERLHFPRPVITFRASAVDDEWRIHCFPLTENKGLCADQFGHTFLFDVDEHHVVTMPSLHKPKEEHLSLFIPSVASDNDSKAGTLHF
ncbi:hypothetical protein E2562_024975 [Oryza meyeriana var. granulata]|uniref:Uncharacterized protein n=1 Tax=Oryza meyeriana var. granulata TaxID=110450 RepID=A0A6G1DMQ8_9ORYZ|nr:hypothetical protein E2562_024975 [Oryza meyeriana var. granulata]